jgi:hypothetical protein
MLMRLETILEYFDAAIAPPLTEEALKTMAYAYAQEARDDIEEINFIWQQVNNLVDGANGTLQMIPIIGDMIAGAVNTVKALSAIEHDLVVGAMHNAVKETFAIHRNEIEKEYEGLQPGLLEDDDAAADIAQFNALC